MTEIRARAPTAFGRKSSTRAAGDAEVSSTSQYTARLRLVLVRL